MENEIDRKIARLRDIYKSWEDQRYLDQIEKRLREKLVRTKLKERPEIQELIKHTKSRIEAINHLLSFDKTLNEPTEEAARKRSRLFDERDINQFWLERLDGSEANKAIENIESIINNLQER